MAEPGSGELQAPTTYPTWKEILERGWFESSEPEIIGEVPNPEEFKKLSVTQGRTVPFEDLPNSLDTFHKALVPTVSLIMEHEKKVNPLAWRNLFRWDIYTHSLASHPNLEPHCDGALLVATPEGLEDRPESRIRYTIATHKGTDFYPGRYDLEPQKIISPQVAPSTMVGFRQSIVEQARLRGPSHTKALEIIRFNELTIHSSPKIDEQSGRRTLFSIDIFPRRS